MSFSHFAYHSHVSFPILYHAAFFSFCAVYIWFLYFILQTVLRHIHSCCVLCLFYLWCACVSFIQSFWSDAQQTQIVNISWKANQVFASSFFFVIQFSNYMWASVCMRMCVSLVHFILRVKDFLKPYCLLFGFHFFLLLLSFIWILVQFFFSSFNLEE